ncbi:MAG: hypothetical protein IPK33_00325 [Gemmatimonadetes bacterium]|nr:hypothetical protein [Gemmatimonadota bacterium]
MRSWSDSDTTSTPAPAGAWFLPTTTVRRRRARRLAPPAAATFGPTVPAATARVEIAAGTRVTVGGARIRLQLAAIHGIDLSPRLVWLDGRRALFASSAGWFITVRRGARGSLPTLRALELQWHDARAAPRHPLRPQAGRSGGHRTDLFDSETGTMRPRATVVIRVSASPPWARRVDPGARQRHAIIDATGRTIIPACGTCTHAFRGRGDGLLQLAKRASPRCAAWPPTSTSPRHSVTADRGTLLGPRMILAGFVEGPGKWAGPTGVVRTEDEARAVVARYDSLGYKPDRALQPRAPRSGPRDCRRAFARGMRLSGHIPAG